MSHKNFFMVSNKIFELKLKPRDFTIYCCLLRHSNEKMQCFPSRRVIATECCMDKKTVDAAIESLSQLGLVKKGCDTVRTEQEPVSLLCNKPLRIA